MLLLAFSCEAFELKKIGALCKTSRRQAAFLTDQKSTSDNFLVVLYF
jgi:hypothetical protein